LKFTKPGLASLAIEATMMAARLSFDARHNVPRIGRVVIARGRDAADVAISTHFGNAKLTRFNVVTEEVSREEYEVLA
jgi:transglutaminase-like putative cysteine protease